MQRETPLCCVRYKPFYHCRGTPYPSNGRKFLHMNAVFIVDAHRVPRFPVSPGMARRLLRTQQAAVLRRYPFTLILKHAAPPLPPVEMRLKIDPGSKTTGLALLQGHVVVWAAELQHRSGGIVEALRTRRGVRRSRRQRHTRYRAPRFNNRTRAPGWLAPSLMSRVHNLSLIHI